MSNRLQYITFLRLLATISVIYIHVSTMFISSLRLNLPSYEYFIYEFIHRFFSFAVPVFILITGALLLKPSKEISYQTVFNKYMLRIIRVLLLFGFVMCFIETYVTKVPEEDLFDIITESIINLITGKSWTHMWYLYMLLGLYALTPLYKVYFAKTDSQSHHYLLCVLIFMCVILPYLNANFVHIENYITLPVFIFLFPCGYYIDTYFKKSKVSLTISFIALIIYTFYIYKTINLNVPFGCSDIFTIIASISLFYLSKFISIKKSILLDKISVHCFCIYIIHTIFLNIFFKVLHIENILNVNPIINTIIVVTITFIASLASSFYLRKITYLRKKVL